MRRAPVLFILIGVLAVACDASSGRAPEQSAGRGDRVYKPVLDALSPPAPPSQTPSQPPKTSAQTPAIEKDYQWARGAKTQDEALKRWHEFLAKHPDAEDGYERMRVRGAQYELMRLEYLVGDAAVGDKLLLHLQDLQPR